MAKKSDIVNFMANNSNNLSKKVAAEALDLALDAIVGVLESGDKLQLVGYFTVEPVARAARKGYNPQTREEIDVPAAMRVRITPGKRLNESVEDLNIQDYLPKNK